MSFFYRIGQYLSALKAEIFGVDGDDYIAKYLSDGEQQLWQAQKAPDRLHSLKVAETADRLQRESSWRLSAEERLILLKAALLHDIGRGEFGSSLAKSLAVILRNKKTDADKRRPEKSEDFFNSGYRASLLYHYYYHPEIGGKMLADLYSRDGRVISEVQKRIIRLVEHHRDETAGDDRLLELLIEADRQN